MCLLGITPPLNLVVAFWSGISSEEGDNGADGIDRVLTPLDEVVKQLWESGQLATLVELIPCVVGLVYSSLLDHATLCR